MHVRNCVTAVCICDSVHLEGLRSVFRTEQVVQQRWSSGHALQPRIAQAVVIVHRYRAIIVRALDKQFNGRGSVLRIRHSILESVGVPSRAVDGDNFAADGEPGLESRPVPRHIHHRAFVINGQPQ